MLKSFVYKKYWKGYYMQKKITNVCAVNVYVKTTTTWRSVFFLLWPYEMRAELHHDSISRSAFGDEF